MYITFFILMFSKLLLLTPSTGRAAADILGVQDVRVHAVPDRPALAVPVFLELPALAPGHHLHSRHRRDGRRLSSKLLFVY